jgi:predicted nucleic acid-binding protein
VRQFFDTSVLVSAFWGDHPGHRASLELFVGANPSTSACAVHSLAETYSVLTRLPIRPVISPDQSYMLVEQMHGRLALVALDGSEYLEVLRRAAQQGFGGGRVYDALLLSCARKFEADRVYTWNLADFQQIAPELADRIRTP